MDLSGNSSYFVHDSGVFNRGRIRLEWKHGPELPHDDRLSAWPRHRGCAALRGQGVSGAPNRSILRPGGVELRSRRVSGRVVSLNLRNGAFPAIRAAAGTAE